MRVCFVASELLGAHKCGGIGTATSHVGLLLARRGYEVSILYTGASPIDLQHPWTERLREAGVDLMQLDAARSSLYPEWLRPSSVVFEYLRGKEQDLVVFQDWEGLGFASTVARRTGLAFSNTTLAVIAHGPTEWLLDANRRAARSQLTLAQIHMERTAFELADALVCPSFHMLEWLQRSGPQLPRRSQVLPLYLWSDPESDEAHRRVEPLDRVGAIAYFGRLEERKGINLFLDALTSERLAFEPLKIFFIGKPASHFPEQIIQVLEQRRPWLASRVRFETDLDSDEAQALLANENCLAVIPSLIDNAPCVVSECLRRAIPFISTMAGGIPELVAEEDRDRVLVPLNAGALAERIGSIAGKPFPPARGTYSEPDVGKQWVEWIDSFRPAQRVTAVTSSESEGDTQPSSAQRPAQGGTMDLAVILTHYERPHLLVGAVESLALQTDTDFRLVLVDDGSQSDAARETLARLEMRNWPFRLEIIRQQNSYLGAARNAGTKASGATHVIFLDDDNRAFPTLVETLRRAALHSGADIITCQLGVFTEPAGEPDPDLLDQGEKWGFTGGPPELGLSINCFGDATGIYRRDVFDRVGFFHELRDVGVEDWHLHARAALGGMKLLSLPVPLYWYRRAATGMLKTTDPFKNNKLIWDTYRALVPKNLSRLIDLAIRHDDMQ